MLLLLTWQGSALEPPGSRLPTRTPGASEGPAHRQGALSWVQPATLQTSASLPAPASHLLAFSRRLQIGTSLGLAAALHTPPQAAGPSRNPPTHTYTVSYRDYTDPYGAQGDTHVLLSVQEYGSGSHPAPAHLCPQAGCVISGNLCNLSEPQFPHL